MNQQKVWGAIAPSWSNFRQKPQDEVLTLAQTWKQGKILDIGCGNCRNLLPFAEKTFECYGIDFSKEMLEQAIIFTKKKNFKVNLKKASMDKLPFKDECFDYCICLASLHHLDSNNKRKKALSEMHRVLKKDGHVLLMVWNKLQFKFLLAKKDSFIPWNLKGKPYERHYHLFTANELQKLVKEEKFLILNKKTAKNIAFLLKRE